ncbi:MAG: GGDEF domain-containing protein [Candidatus Cloacimonadales bacterium]
MKISKNQWAMTGYFSLGIILSLSITVIRYITGPAFQIEQFYLIPIAIVAWYVNRDAATIIATISILFWVIFDFFTMQTLAGGLAPGLNEVFRLIIFIFIILLIDKTKYQIKKLTQQSVTDPLTQLLNRRAFFQHLERELEVSRRYETSVSLIYIDLDNFKTINDTLGHQAGDKVLKTTSQILTENTRNSDIIGRMGGDEFCIILPQTTAQAAQIVYEKLSETTRLLFQRNRWPVSLSAGIIEFYDKELSGEVLVNKADELMYKAKNSGKNKFETI